MDGGIHYTSEKYKFLDTIIPCGYRTPTPTRLRLGRMPAVLSSPQRLAKDRACSTVGLWGPVSVQEIVTANLKMSNAVIIKLVI